MVEKNDVDGARVNRGEKSKEGVILEKKCSPVTIFSDMPKDPLASWRTPKQGATGPNFRFPFLTSFKFSLQRTGATAARA